MKDYEKYEFVTMDGNDAIVKDKESGKFYRLHNAYVIFSGKDSSDDLKSSFTTSDQPEQDRVSPTIKKLSEKLYAFTIGENKRTSTPKPIREFNVNVASDGDMSSIACSDITNSSGIGIRAMLNNWIRGVEDCDPLTDDLNALPENIPILSTEEIRSQILKRRDRILLPSELAHIIWVLIKGQRISSIEIDSPKKNTIYQRSIRDGDANIIGASKIVFFEREGVIHHEWHIETEDMEDMTYPGLQLMGTEFYYELIDAIEGLVNTESVPPMGRYLVFLPIRKKMEMEFEVLGPTIQNILRKRLSFLFRKLPHPSDDIESCGFSYDAITKILYCNEISFIKIMDEDYDPKISGEDILYQHVLMSVIECLNE